MPRMSLLSDPYVYRCGQSICASVFFIYTIGRVAFSSQFCRVNRKVMNKY